jgi:hypothetical protein
MIKQLQTALFPMALIALAEGDLVVMAGEALDLAAVVSDSDKPLFSCLEQLLAGAPVSRMAI